MAPYYHFYEVYNQPMQQQEAEKQINSEGSLVKGRTRNG